MEIKYRNKPTQELINRYSNKIEEFLSAHQLKIEIEINDIPGRSEFYVDNQLTEKANYWLGRIVVRSQAVNELEVRIGRSGIEDNISDHEIWRDAFLIQDQIYKHLKIKSNIKDLAVISPGYTELVS